MATGTFQREMPWFEKQISHNTNYTFSIPSGSGGMVVGMGSQTRVMYLFNATSVGAVAYTAIKSDADITVTAGTNTLKVANASGGALICYVLALRGEGVS